MIPGLWLPIVQAPSEVRGCQLRILEINANFELKHGLINLVQNKQFFSGHDNEDSTCSKSVISIVTSTMRFSDIAANYTSYDGNELTFIDMDCEEYFKMFLVFKWDLECNPTPYYVLIVFTSSPTLIIGDSDFLIFEEKKPSLSLAPHEVDTNFPGGVDTTKDLKICETNNEKSSVNEPPEVELKDLPPHLEYAFLERSLGDSFSTCYPFGGKKCYNGMKTPTLALNWEKSHFMVKDGIVLDTKSPKSGCKPKNDAVDPFASKNSMLSSRQKRRENLAPIIFPDLRNPHQDITNSMARNLSLSRECHPSRKTSFSKMSNTTSGMTPSCSKSVRIKYGYIKNYKKTVKNGQARTRESEEYKKKPKIQSRSQKSQVSEECHVVERKAQVKNKIALVSLTELAQHVTSKNDMLAILRSPQCDPTAQERNQQ
ncbi:hypothetical protein Tco_0414828 [Tanacetum coccineum]